MATEDLKCLGLNAKLLKGLAKNEEKCAALLEIVAQARDRGDLNKDRGPLVYEVATTLPDSLLEFRGVLLDYVMDDRIATKKQVKEAVIYLQKLPAGSEVDHEAFSATCGVGVSISGPEIEAIVAAEYEADRDAIVEQRYLYPFGDMMTKLRNGPLKWADGKLTKAAMDKHQLALLGEKTEADAARAKEAKKAKAKAGKAGAAGAKGKGGKTKGGKDKGKEAGEGGASQESNAAGFGARDMKAAINSAALLEEHRVVTGGRVRTRFPPEPNGYLHIGHAKSMFLNFKAAFERVGREGDCIFRYDDTNPEAESTEYIDSLRDTVEWMGWTPVKTTFSSDYFPQLHALAQELIRRGKAYVCHQTKADMARSRDIARERFAGRSTPTGPESPWRGRSVEENLREFEKMRLGCYAEGTATLRMKMDWANPNPNFWDPVAYRIKYVPHPHSGSAWCIYPSYDFTHCLVDALEHIDYSLCTLEFESRRDSYYWLLEALDMWRPHVWEFGRLNLTHTMMSKRKLLKLVNDRVVRGWDDPRLPTIMGVRRRGYPPQAINAFCADISAARANNTFVNYSLVEHHVRAFLNEHAARAMVVLAPLRVTIANASQGVSTVEVPVHPDQPERGVLALPFHGTVFIDASDFREVDEPKYFGLAPGKVVVLRYAGTAIRCTGVEKDAEGRVVALTAETVDMDVAKAETAARGKKAKLGVLHWVASAGPGKEPLRAEVRLYNHLFVNPTLEDGKSWEEQLNPESEVVVSDAVVFDAMATAGAGDRFQFERTGYFCVDTDSRPDKLVFNRTCSLRETRK